VRSIGIGLLRPSVDAECISPVKSKLLALIVCVTLTQCPGLMKCKLIVSSEGWMFGRSNSKSRCSSFFSFSLSAVGSFLQQPLHPEIGTQVETARTTENRRPNRRHFFTAVEFLAVHIVDNGSFSLSLHNLSLRVLLL